MTANLDFCAIENSTGIDAPRTDPAPARISSDDAYIDVTSERDIPPVVPVSPGSGRLISRRDRFSLMSVLLVISAAFLYGHIFGGSSAEQPPRLSAYRVDLNTAGLEELVLLEGVGEVTAENILLDRERNGPFVTGNQLQRVKGIGPKTIERLREHVVCR